MSEASKIHVPKVKLGTQGLEVSKLGFGCMGLTGVYNSPVSDEDGVSIIVAAFDRGITFFDTADVYGPHTNELLLGKALKQLPREKIQVATKFGVVFGGPNPPGVTAKGSPEYVRQCCEASLKRLDVSYIDLYYQHRVDTSVPIEETMGELRKLVEEGKIKYIGLSEASPDTIRRAHAVHPITALQMEWSLWTREIEEEIVPLCRELGIGIVPYSPLGRGFFGGKAVVEALPSNSALLTTHPRFIGENLEKNKNIYTRMESLAEKHQCLTAQLALAWVLHQGDDVVPIPGTTKIKNLDANIGSLKLKLGEEALKEVSGAVPLDQIAGERTYGTLIHLQWQFANTPPKVSKMGYGCMGLTGVYNSPVSEEDGISIIVAAFNKGITFFDTADRYGAHTNELLLGKALKQLPREKVQVATKFGCAGAIDPLSIKDFKVTGTPEYARSCCEASLKRLDVDYIDLYYQHRVDTTVPIEETMGELKKLVEEGKVKYIGLSEASPDTIRRAHAVHPITALQMEWSLWSRDIEEEIVPLCRELGVGIVTYCPLGSGFFGGKGVAESAPSNSALSSLPRFVGENLEKNKIIYNKIESLAQKHHCLTSQLALSWVLHQGDDVVPIPGTTKIKNLDANIGSLKLKLREEDLKQVAAAVPLDQVAGERTYGALMHLQWQFANTPPNVTGNPSHPRIS